MKNKPEASTNTTALRRQAESKLLESKGKEALSTAKTRSQRLIHELEVHQIEIELQNEELNLAQVKMNAALRQYEGLYDSAPAIYLTLAQDGTILHVNLPGANLLGEERGALIKRRLGLFVSARSLPAFNTFLKDVFGSAKKGNCEVEFIKYGHEQRWVYMEAVVSDVLFGNEVVCQAVAMDISKRRQLEAEFHEQNKRFANLTANIPCYIAFVNANTLRYEFVNELYETSFGIPCEKIIGRHLRDVIGEANYQFALEYIDQARSGKSVSYENTFKLVSGPHWVQINYAPIPDGDGQVTSIAVLGFDITERKQAEFALRESQTRYQMIFENSGTANSIFDTECRLILQNSLSIQSLGTKAGEALGKTALELFGPVRGLVVTSRMRCVLDSGLAESFETEFELVTGKKWFRSTYQPLFDEEKILTGVQVISQDISKDKLAEQSLRESEIKLRKAQHFAHIGSWTWNIKTNQLDWSDEMYNIFGLDQGTFSGSLPDVIAQAIHPDDRAKVDQSNQAVIEEGRPAPLEYRIVWSDGTVRVVWAEAGEMILDDTGAPYLLSGTVQDITERKQAQEKLHLQGVMLEASANAIVITDRNGSIEWANPAFSVLKGYLASDEVLGTNLRNLIRSDQQDDEFYNDLWNTVMAGSVWHGELINRRKDGSLYDEEMTITPVRNERGEIANFIAIKQDISDRRQVEKLIQQYAYELENQVAERTAELSRVNSDLARALRARDEFLASVSHELRTPLTGILALSKVLELETQGDLNERQQKTVSVIEESGQHLLALINDILDLSKIEAGKLELNFAQCSIGDICQASLHMVKGLAYQNKQYVQYQPVAEPIQVLADPRRLKQILVNLLGNSIKFTAPSSEIGLEVRANAAEQIVQLTVWDKGIGIKPEDFRKILKPFVQIDSGLTREYSGTGLGLSLVRYLTEMHNGSLEVESVFGGGSRFTVTLPWVPIPDPAADGSSDVPIPVFTGLVMLADDNERSLQMTAGFLEEKQVRVVKVRSGAELLEKGAALHPDVLLVDIQLLGMDGSETIRRIRTHPDPLIAGIPLIALADLILPGDRAFCLQAGANEFMAKPVRLKELLGIIEKLTGDEK